MHSTTIRTDGSRCVTGTLCSDGVNEELLGRTAAPWPGRAGPRVQTAPYRRESGFRCQHLRDNLAALDLHLIATVMFVIGAGVRTDRAAYPGHIR